MRSATRSPAIKEPLELLPACIDTGMSYDERMARRVDESTSWNSLGGLGRYVGDDPVKGRCPEGA